MADQPQNPNQAIDLMGPITVVHLILMALLAAAAILVVWWGTVLHRRRKRAAAQVAEDFRIAEQHGATSAPADSVRRDETATVSADVPETPGEALIPSGTGAASDLTQIKGLGPKLVTLLTERGVTTVGQLAALSPEDAAALDAGLGTFQGRMTRDRWVEQAKLLNAGDTAGYEAAFGKLGG